MAHYQMPELTEAGAAEFWSQIDTKGFDECWPWVGKLDNDGYGIFQFKYRNYKTNRIAYYLHTGIDPDFSYVCHSCDNPVCCNPAHLWKGSPSSNTLDAIKKGRFTQHLINAFPKGEDNPSGKKLNPDKVLEIRRLSAEGMTRRAVGAKFGIAIATVQHIVRRKLWKHIPEEANGPPPPKIEWKCKTGGREFTDNQVRYLRQAYLDGATLGKLAKMAHVRHDTVSKIIHRRTYQDVED